MCESADSPEEDEGINDDGGGREDNEVNVCYDTDNGRGGLVFLMATLPGRWIQFKKD